MNEPVNVKQIGLMFVGIWIAFSTICVALLAFVIFVAIAFSSAKKQSDLKIKDRNEQVMSKFESALESARFGE